MTEQKDWIDKVMDDYLYNSDCDSPYPPEAIEQSENDETIKEARKLFRELINKHLPKDNIQIERLLKFKQYLPTQSLIEEYDTILQSLPPKHTDETTT